MYECELKGRRITTLIRQEAYKWLENNINRYEVGSNSEAARLVLEIKKTGVNKERYDAFVDKLMGDPYTYALYGAVESKKHFSIMTRDISCMFVSFDKTPLPIEFITTFFEDDYETQEDIDNLLRAALLKMREEFKLRSEENNLSQKENTENLKKSFYYIFDTKTTFHVTNVLKIIMSITVFITCIYFFFKNDVIKMLVKYEENEAFFTLFNTLVLLLDVFLVVFMASKIKRAVQTIIFYINLIIVRLRVSSFLNTADNFEGKVFAPLFNYFNSNEMMNRLIRARRIDDGICQNVPQQKKLYMKLNNFNAESIAKKVIKLRDSKYFAHLNFAYDKNDMVRSNKVWKRGVVVAVVATIVIMFLNVDYLRGKAVDFYNYCVEAILEDDEEDKEKAEATAEATATAEPEPTDSLFDVPLIP